MAFYDDPRPIEPFIPWMIQVVREMAEYSVWNRVSPYGDHIAASALGDLPDLRRGEKTLPVMFAQCQMVLQIGHEMIELLQAMDRKPQARDVQGIVDRFQQECRERFFYRDLVGIAPDLHRPAFAHFFLRPILPRQVGSVEFQYESPRGLIRSHMVRQGNRLRWTVVVPPNAIATLSFPSGKIDEITESGKAVLEAIGIAVGKD